MRRLIKNGELVQDTWQLVDSLDASQVREGRWLLPLDALLTLSPEQCSADHLGVVLQSDADVFLLKPYLGKLGVIALHFELFMDGRSFSQARTLRDTLDFHGEIRAVGNFIQDQIYYLSRCGVNAYSLPDHVSVEAAQARLKDFSEAYQAACDEPQPLFRRRV